MITEIQGLTKRIEDLERETWCLKRWGAGIVFGLAGLAAMGASAPRSVPETIEAKRFVSRDASGNVRMVVGVDAHGAGFLALNDSDGSSMLQSRGDAYLREKGIDPESPTQVMIARLKQHCDHGDGESCYGLAEFYDPARNVSEELRQYTNTRQARLYYEKACAAGFNEGCEAVKELQK